MPGTVFQIRINDLVAKMRNVKRALTAASMAQAAKGVMMSSISRTFQQQGYDGVRWLPLKPSTIAARRNKVASSIKILQDTGRLRSSIQFRVEGKRLIIGTNLRYAPIQQMGGVAGRKPPFKKKNGHRALLPARPFMVIRSEDPKRIKEAIEAMVQKRIDAAGAGRK